MESTNSEQKKTKKAKLKEAIIPNKNYEKMYYAGLDAFSLLGLSDNQYHLIKNPNSLRVLIEQALIDEKITPSDAPGFFAQMKGANIATFHELANLIEETYHSKQHIQHEVLQDCVDTIISIVKRKQEELYNPNNIFSVKDLLALTQYKTIKDVTPTIDKNLLLTKETIKENGLKLNENAVPYKHPVTSEELYGWPFVKSYWRSNELDMPLKDYYGSNILLNQEEQKFPELKTFENHTIAKGFKLLPTIKATTLEDTVVISGKKLMYDKNVPISNTEKALLMMYELNLDYLKPKRKFIITRKKDNVKKELKAYFYNRALEKELGNSTKTQIKFDKQYFDTYLQTVRDVIATFATINQARIYMKGDTFKKVEQNLTIQASMKLATLPDAYSTWVMPFIAEKVYEVSKKNYMEVGITSIQALKNLYEQTGRDCSNAKTGEEVIFAPFKQLVKENIGDKETVVKEANPENVAATETIKTEEAAPIIDKKSDLLKAKDSLKIFLDENLLMKNSFSETPAVEANAKLIQELNDKKVNMQAISDYIYNKIVDDMEKNSANYKKLDGNFHKYGVDLLKDYFKSLKCERKPRETFKNLIEEAKNSIREEEPTIIS